MGPLSYLLCCFLILLSARILALFITNRLFLTWFFPLPSPCLKSNLQPAKGLISFLWIISWGHINLAPCYFTLISLCHSKVTRFNLLGITPWRPLNEANPEGSATTVAHSLTHKGEGRVILPLRAVWPGPSQGARARARSTGTAQWAHLKAVSGVALSFCLRSGHRARDMHSQPHGGKRISGLFLGTCWHTKPDVSPLRLFSVEVPVIKQQRLHNPFFLVKDV